jgi:hypothetical protein
MPTCSHCLTQLELRAPLYAVSSCCGIGECIVRDLNPLNHYISTLMLDNTGVSPCTSRLVDVCVYPLCVPHAQIADAAVHTMCVVTAGQRAPVLRSISVLGCPVTLAGIVYAPTVCYCGANAQTLVCSRGDGTMALANQRNPCVHLQAL